MFSIQSHIMREFACTLFADWVHLAKREACTHWDDRTGKHNARLHRVLRAVRLAHRSLSHVTHASCDGRAFFERKGNAATGEVRNAGYALGYTQHYGRARGPVTRYFGRGGAAGSPPGFSVGRKGRGHPLARSAKERRIEDAEHPSEALPL